QYLDTVHQLSSEFKGIFGCLLSTTVAEHGGPGGAGLEDLAVGADLGVEHQFSPTLAEERCYSALLSEPAIELTEEDTHHTERRVQVYDFADALLEGLQPLDRKKSCFGGDQDPRGRNQGVDRQQAE